jgi:hypothetical protein
MRASDLIGRDVVDGSGARLGVITDLRCVQDGPVVGASARLRVVAVLISRRHTGATLGYDRRPDLGPWPLRVLVRQLHRHMRVISWSELDVSAEMIGYRGQ